MKNNYSTNEATQILNDYANELGIDSAKNKKRYIRFCNMHNNHWKFK